MRDFRLWWALFVLFAVLSVLAIQHAWRRWRRLRELLPPSLGQTGPAQLDRQRRREGWRVALMIASLLVMTGLVYAGVLGAPRGVLLVLRVAAVGLVGGVVVLSLRW
ncbi:MAG TPA: hypothetical protein VF046_11095 [Gemmatimonadales bacterium]